MDATTDNISNHEFKRDLLVLPLDTPLPHSSSTYFFGYPTIPQSGLPPVSSLLLYYIERMFGQM